MCVTVIDRNVNRYIPGNLIKAVQQTQLQPKNQYLYDSIFMQQILRRNNLEEKLSTLVMGVV